MDLEARTGVRDWQFCAFCGQKPRSKTKEHIVPMWLQRFAGNEKVPATFSAPGGVHARTWASYTLPACRECNETFGEIEQHMKRVFERIRTGAITGIEMKLMLLWLDKVRVGLWLLSLTLGKKSHAISPNFQIRDRLGQADHLVRVFRYRTDAKGIALVGSDTNAFVMMPCVIGIIVRDVVILSVSAGGFLQERMGLAVQSNLLPEDGKKPRPVYAAEGKGYDPTWSSSLFRFKYPAYFKFHHVAGGLPGFQKDVLYTDRSGQLQEVGYSERLEVPQIGHIDASTKLKFMLEVTELQRILLMEYRHYDLDAAGRAQVKRAQRQLDENIDAYVSAYNAFAPLPIHRRTFLHWI